MGSTSRFEAELKRRILNQFPNGIENVSLKDFQSAPADGVLLREENDLLRKAGMKTGDVIVALNGIRIHNVNQYGYGRKTATRPEMSLIVWQGDQYREIKASPPNHLFGVRLANYNQE
jgi:hypothetical protein